MAQHIHILYACVLQSRSFSFVLLHNGSFCLTVFRRVCARLCQICIAVRITFSEIPANWMKTLIFYTLFPSNFWIITSYNIHSKHHYLWNSAKRLWIFRRIDIINSFIYCLRTQMLWKNKATVVAPKTIKMKTIGLVSSTSEILKQIKSFQNKYRHLNGESKMSTIAIKCWRLRKRKVKKKRKKNVCFFFH